MTTIANNKVDYGSALEKIALINKMRKACIANGNITAKSILSALNNNKPFVSLQKELSDSDRGLITSIFGEELTKQVINF